MLEKAFATISGFASNSFRSEFSDWSRLAEWTKRNPARWIYGIAGLWLSLYVLLSHKSHVAEFIAEYNPLQAGDAIYDLLLTIWLVACMFSFFSERPGTKWLRRSLVIFTSSAELLNLWDIGVFGIVWIVIAWAMFIVIERAVFDLDEASRRIRQLKYVLFTIALSASYTSVGVVFLWKVEFPFWYLPMFLILWGVTALWMFWAYGDRSDPQGATFFNKACLMKYFITIIIAIFLSRIIEIAFGIPADDPISMPSWIEENVNVSTRWTGYVLIVIMAGPLGVGAAVTWLGANALSRIKLTAVPWNTRR